jgi:hypothetical protein
MEIHFEYVGLSIWILIRLRKSSCKHGNEILNSTNNGQFLQHPSDHKLLKMALVCHINKMGLLVK